MTGTDLHPEDLLERDIRGELRADERERLELHLGQCAVCRLERIARNDFRSELEGEDGEIDAGRLVSALLAPRDKGAVRRPASRSRARFFGLVLVAAAGVTAAGWAAAARWTGLRTWSLSAVLPAKTVAPPPPPPAPARSWRKIEPRLPDPEASAKDLPVIAPAAAPLLSEAPRRPAVAARVTLARAVVREPTEPIAEAVVAPDAPDLFGRANAARRAGDHGRAEHSYRELIERYPASPEARAALAVLGRMLLDDGEAGAALRCFDEYLAGAGPLREEAHLGRALSLQRLGRTDDEAQAWSALLAFFPASVHADRAKRRLLALGKQ
jgi:tetratricopeptide (TPR) repeat protein